MPARMLMALAFAAVVPVMAHADALDDANAALYRGDYGTAAKLLQPLAQMGDPVAQNDLGSLYSQGLGVKRDPAQAVMWYAAAAAQGLAEAENNLGYQYEQGAGVPMDVAMALTWYQRAADQGYALAEFNVGLFYQNGVAVMKDKISAYLWLSLASAQGRADARTALGQLLAEMSPDEVTQGHQTQTDYQRAHKTPTAPGNR